MKNGEQNKPKQDEKKSISKRPLRGLNPNQNKPNNVRENAGSVNNSSTPLSTIGIRKPFSKMKQGLFGGGLGSTSDNSNNTTNFSSENTDTIATDDNVSGDNEASDIVGKIASKAGKKIGKALIIKIIISMILIFAFLAIFICVLCLPLFVLGIVDVGDVSHMFDSIYSGNNTSTNNYTEYVSTSDNTSYWWPIGGSETTIINGKLFATGTPSSLTITATFAGDDSTHNGAHGAVDIGAPVNGANVIATMDGVVIYPGENARIDYPNGWYNEQTHTCSSDGGGFGNYVKIDHGNGLVSIYGHMYANTITVREGDVVKQGQVIGRTGTSGCSTGGHLHFEFRLNGTKVDPLDYVSVSEPRKVVTNNVNNSTRTEMVE